MKVYGTIVGVLTVVFMLLFLLDFSYDPLIYSIYMVYFVMVLVVCWWCVRNSK